VPQVYGVCTSRSIVLCDYQPPWSEQQQQHGHGIVLISQDGEDDGEDDVEDDGADELSFSFGSDFDFDLFAIETLDGG
jgi:hypothetical protein